MEHNRPSIRSILFVDLEGRSLPPQSFLDVARLAHENGASLTVWNAVAEDGRRRPIRPGRPRNRRHLEQRRTDAARSLSASWSAAVDASLHAKFELAAGPWSSTVSNDVAGGRHDLVVVHHAGAGQAVRRIRRLLRTCSSPLLVVGAELGSGIVAEVHADDVLQLNTRIVELASALAIGLRCDLEFVCPLDGNETSRATEIRSRLDDLFATLDPAIPTEVTVEVGRPVELVDEHARRRGAGIVAIGGSGRLGTKSKLLGNAAEHLLSTTSRSVLIVAPTADKLARSPRRSAGRRPA